MITFLSSYVLIFWRNGFYNYVKNDIGVLGINVDIEAVFLTCVVVAHAFMMGHIAEEVA
jgi:hypothetical protein